MCVCVWGEVGLFWGEGGSLPGWRLPGSEKILGRGLFRANE